MVYAFTSDRDQVVMFSTCWKADFNTHIIVYDTFWNVVDENYHNGGAYWSCVGNLDNPWVYTSVLWENMVANQTFFVLVEGADTFDVGNFVLRVACDQ